MKKNAKVKKTRKSRRGISDAALEKLRKAAEREFDYKLDIDFYEAWVAADKIIDAAGQRTKDPVAIRKYNRDLAKAKKAADIARNKLARV